MPDLDLLAERFDAHRGHLRAVAYRMLGSLSESDDAVQEAWLRASRADASKVENLGGWLTTIVARVCLNILRARATRPEQPYGIHMPDPVLSRAEAVDPEREAVLADSVGLALLVVLDTLTPAERLCFVLHDMFAVPFDEIAPIVPCTPAAARQLASRARRRVQQAPTPDRDPVRQREVVDAFFAASRNGDFEALVAVLHPDVVLRSDGGTGRPAASLFFRGAQEVAGNAVMYGVLAPHARPVLVNGAPGVVVVPRKEAVSVMAFTVNDGLIVAIDVLADPDRLRTLGVSSLAG
ncbi:RNA polymerase sigma factor SigJ [Agromyces sp. Soil535]|uniref:RNA polymerase sigma factor SigJ n=1 Tax=Agromyces sp. Soil535 TaxID=1736390 RepID=UPI0006FC3D64|nr:RNA polymerase sigma factor SigJ [Agromyces sp. Soil535]KRE23435.1 RNA polymerase subunit sigma-70 [Agromyces sp. Soil535]